MGGDVHAAKCNGRPLERTVARTDTASRRTLWFMPELPEVEDAVRRLRDAITGRRIVCVAVRHPSLARRLPPRDRARIEGHTVVRVERHGKHQLIVLDDGSVLAAHFRMTGDWVLGRAGDPMPRYARAMLDLDDGTRVVLADPRALATFVRRDTVAGARPEIGVEPTDPAFTSESLGRALERRRGPIKPALLDQRVVAGLGNIYAAESLWLARIDPRVSARRLGPARRARLVASIRRVLDRAPGGRYWNDARRARWRVYDREGLACTRCGSTIRRIVQAGRSTYFCPGCQQR